MSRVHAARRTKASPAGEPGGEHLTRAQKEELAAILDDLEAAYKRHYIFASEHHATVVTLYTLMNYCRDDAGQTIFTTLLFLYLRTKDSGAGKSRLLRMIGMLTCGSFGPYVNPYPADLYRAASAGQLLLLDEITRWFNPDLQSILNSCDEPGRSVPRQMPDGSSVEWPVFCPVVMSGRDDKRDIYDDTIRRSYVIDCKTEHHARVTLGREWNAREFEEIVAAPLRERMAAWARKALPVIRAAAGLPMKDLGIKDDNPDIVAYPWKPLFALAHLAGREWTKRVAAAAADITADAVTSDTVSEGQAFLDALRTSMERANPFLRFSDYETGERPKLSGRLTARAFGWKAGSSVTPCGSLGCHIAKDGIGRWELRIPSDDFPRIAKVVSNSAPGQPFHEHLPRILRDLRDTGVLLTDGAAEYKSKVRVWKADKDQRRAYRFDITRWFDDQQQDQEGKTNG